MPQALAGILLAAGVSAATVAFILTTLSTVFWSVAAQRLTQALTKKKLSDSAPEATPEAPISRTITARDTIYPRQMIYGGVQTAGAIVGMFVAGPNNRHLVYVVAYAGHEVDEFVSFKINNVTIIAADLVAGSPGDPFLDELLSMLNIVYYNGDTSQSVDSFLTSSIEAWDATHVGKGIAYARIVMTSNNTVWKAGPPQDVFAFVNGRKLYDPRKDSTNGGSGSHRTNDATTWEWSNNWALCVRDYISGGSITYDYATPDKRLTIGEDDARIDDEYIITAANIADEMVTVPAPVLAGTVTFTSGSAIIAGVDTNFEDVLSIGDFIVGADSAFYEVDSIASNTQLTLTSNYAGSTVADTIAQWNTTASATTTQKRYTCDTQLSCDATHRQNLSTLLSAGYGHISYVQGKYRVFAGAYVAPTVDLNADDIQGEVSIVTHPDGENVYNMVGGTFFDELRGWSEQNFASQTDTSYQTDDGGLYQRTISLNATRDNFRCQRIANVDLLQSRNKTIVNFERLSPKAVLISEWDIFTVTIEEFGWAAKTFRCIAWKFLPDGFISITAREDSAASYADLAVADYQLPRNTFSTGPTATQPAPPDSLTLTSFPGVIRAEVAGTFAEGTIVEIWEYTSNSPFSSATKIASGVQLVFDIHKADTTPRFYWARTRLNGATSLTAPLTNGTQAQALPGLPATSLTATAIAGGITFTWAAAAAQPTGTVWELYEYTANTPFASATKIWEGDALTYTKLGDTPTAKYYWIRARTNGTASTEYPSGNGVSGQGLAPVAPTGLTLTGFPTYIRAAISGTFAQGTVVEIWEYTANTPFASATKVAEGEANVLYIARRDTTTRYYWARTRLSGQTSSTFPSGNGTGAAADLNNTDDIDAGAITDSITMDDTAPNGSTNAGGLHFFGSPSIGPYTFDVSLDATATLTAFNDSAGTGKLKLQFDDGVGTSYGVEQRIKTTSEVPVSLSYVFTLIAGRTGQIEVYCEGPGPSNEINTQDGHLNVIVRKR